MIVTSISWFRHLWRAFWIAVCFGATPFAATAQDEVWLPLRDQSLVVAPGSALDLSALVEPGTAGQFGWAQALPNGHIGFEKRKIPQRFLAASLVVTGPNGGMPDHGRSDAMVAQLRRTGYNLVRLHFVDAQLMAGKSKDFDFDPVQLERLHYLLAVLARGGIYWIVDGLTSDNGAWGDVQPHRFAKKHNAKLDLLTSETGFQHWATLVQKIWGTKNPHNGVAPINDPAMLGMILVNEGSLGYLSTINGNRYSPTLKPLFLAWLRERYNTDVALQAAWGGERRSDESLSTQVAIPSSVRGRSARDTDFARFIVELERKSYQRMEAKVRSLGFGGLTTAFGNWAFVNADITRSALPWVDMHSYHALPTNHGQPGSRIAQTSVHSNVARYVRELTNTRQWGKPFTVSEYGQPFWNRWRHESAALMPAVAALQDWDAICQFAETPIQFDYGPSTVSRLQAMYPYGVGGDPIARAGERLAAMLFKRGDISPARGSIRLHLDADRMLARSGGWEQVPEGLSRLGLVTAIGLDFAPMPTKPVDGRLDVDLNGTRPTWLTRLENTLVKSGADTLLANSSNPLRDAGVINSSNLTQPHNQVYQSDTGQLIVDSANGLIKVASARTAVLVMRNGAAASGPITVRDATAPALFAFSSLDDQPLAQSARMLLWVLTDAINTGMSFDDAERTTIRTVGRMPPMVQAIAATIRLEHANASRLKVWPLSLAGDRRTPLVFGIESGAVQLKLDTAALPDGPALFFEIAFE